ncbi:MAG: MFS transporter [bacterium]
MSARPATSWPRLLLLFTAASFLEAALYGHVSAFAPLHLPRLGVLRDEVARWTGLSVALSTSVGIPFLPLWGALADRYARKPIIVRSFIAHILACVTMALAGGLWVFIAGRAAMSFALGNSGLMMTTLSERAPRERIGLAFSIMNGAAPVGAFVGPLLGGPIVDAWGFPSLLLLDAAFMLAVGVALAFGYRDPFTPSERGRILTMAADSMRIIWRSPRLRALFPALFVLFSGWMLAFIYVPLVTTALYRGGDPGAAVGLVMGAGGLGALVLSPVIGALADRFGHWRTLFVAAVAEVALWPLPAYAGTFGLFTLAWAVLNGVAAGVFAISFSVLSNSAPSHVRGRVMSFAYLPVTVGLLIGPSLGSVISTRSVFTVFPAAAVMTALGVGAMAVAARQNGGTRSKT